MILEAKNVTCGYGPHDVLKGLDLEFSQTRVVGIIGPNGSGKTTFIRAATRILPLKGGSIYFKGNDMRHMGFADIARNIAVVSQLGQTYFSNFLVEEFVMLGRTPHYERFQWAEKRRDIDIALNAMELLSVMDLRDRPINQLSGGELQRVLIARALAQEPRLLLMDEPTSHLDINHRVEIFETIKRLTREKGITVVSVLHDLNLASRFCDSIIFFKDGRAAYKGKPEDVTKKEYIKEVYNNVDVNVYIGTMSDVPQILY